MPQYQVELFGMSNQLVGLRRVEVELDDGACLEDLVAALRRKIPALEGSVIRRGEDRLTNHVAAPIKFSEYMCSGLPCIVSDRVGDTAEVIRRGNAGIVLDSQNRFPTLSEFQGLLSLNRGEISKSMKEKYSSEVYLPQLLKLYEGLNAG